MRGTIDGALSAVPLAPTLPAMIREDPFAQALCAGLDEVLAPVLMSLDAFPAYLDLGTTPPDMLPWLGHWLGMEVDPGEDLALQRQLLASAGELHAIRGTRRGIELALEAALGVDVQVLETGGSSWSTDPAAPLPGEHRPAIVVIVESTEEDPIDTERLDALVTHLKPAHVLHRIQLNDA
ncbi:MAG TPA: phage tail protein [Microlunatus sp.]|nr:phage tail protein [Microlunatus sp.]